MPSHSRTRPRRLPKAQRQALILAALPSIQRLAKLLAFTYCPARFDADDLCQIGVLEALECMQRGFRAKGDKVRYLVGVARLGMRHYCGEHRGYLRTPYNGRKRAYPTAPVVLSLDAALSDDGLTLLDVLADDYNAAYELYEDSLPV